MTVKIDKGQALGALSITPLIDIVFLLLIFFLVATRFAEEDRELDVLLPSASEAKPLTVRPREIFVNIDQDGNYFVGGGKPKTLDEVYEILRRAGRDNPGNQSVVIRADKRVPLNYAVEVMNLCNRSGIFDYTITTEGTGG
jgi:biopolymer transport protein ExbD